MFGTRANPDYSFSVNIEFEILDPFILGPNELQKAIRAGIQDMLQDLRIQTGVHIDVKRKRS